MIVRGHFWIVSISVRETKATLMVKIVGDRLCSDLSSKQHLNCSQWLVPSLNVSVVYGERLRASGTNINGKRNLQ